MTLFKTLILIGGAAGVIGTIVKSKFLRHGGFIIAWFAVLCLSYQSPMFGNGIEPSASVKELFNSMSPAFAISLLIPMAFIIYHLYGIYHVIYRKEPYAEDELP